MDDGAQQAEAVNPTLTLPLPYPTPNQAEAAERFKHVQAAWAVLSDAELRVTYDEELEKQ